METNIFETAKTEQGDKDLKKKTKRRKIKTKNEDRLEGEEPTQAVSTLSKTQSLSPVSSEFFRATVQSSEIKSAISLEQRSWIGINKELKFAVNLPNKSMVISSKQPEKYIQQQQQKLSTFNQKLKHNQANTYKTQNIGKNDQAKSSINFAKTA